MDTDSIAQPQNIISELDLTSEEEVGRVFLKDVERLECALYDPSMGIYGQSWHVDIDVTGVKDENGFVHDFSKLKKLIRQVLKETLDHALLLPISSQSVSYNEMEGSEHWVLREQSAPNHTNSPAHNGVAMGWEYKCPQGCVYPIRSVAIRDSHVAQEISRLLRHRLPSSITSIGVRLREETTDPTEATFRYTHGIQNHDGLCQRIFHGHRSKVEVYCGEERRPDLEHYIVRTLLNSSVHIATPSQIKSGSFEIGKLGNPQEQVLLSFQGSKGAYQAKVPGNKLFVVDQETSIECITMHLAKALKNKDPQITKKIKVVCYEGIDKGAIAIL